LCSAAGDDQRAAGMALELCIYTGVRGNHTVALGWVQRAESLLENSEPCSELGRFREMQAAVANEIHGDADAALALLDEVLEIGRACNDRDLVAGAMVGRGSILVRLGRVEEGMRLVDEAMIDAVSGQLGAVRTARVYCG